MEWYRTKSSLLKAGKKMSQSLFYWNGVGLLEFELPLDSYGLNPCSTGTVSDNGTI